MAGCVPQANPKGSIWSTLSIVGVQQIDKVVDVVEETLQGNTIQYLKERKEIDGGTKRKAGGASLDLPKIRRNNNIEIIPINTGCLNQCTYCKTKHARGNLGSYSLEDITVRVKSVITEGVVEIWLTSEDLGAYGRDIGVSITELLWRIIETIEESDKEGNVMLRVGMTNPPYILEHLEEMCKILNHPRVYSFLHVPVQAASDTVLDDMRRLYTLADYKKVVDTLIENVPGITIATDVICGFPTETADDFEITLKLVEEYKFPALHISQFYPRPGTPASRLPLLPTQEVKRRSRALTSLFESYTKNDESLIGTILEGVLVTDRSSDGVHLIAHDKAYRQILVPIAEDGEEWIKSVMARKLDVRVTNVGKYHLIGEPLNEVKVKGKKTMGPAFVRIKKRIVKVSEDDVRVSNVEGARNAESEVAVKADEVPDGSLLKDLVFYVIVFVLITGIMQDAAIKAWIREYIL